MEQPEINQNADQQQQQQQPNVQVGHPEMGRTEAWIANYRNFSVANHENFILDLETVVGDAEMLPPPPVQAEEGRDDVGVGGGNENGALSPALVADSNGMIVADPIAQQPGNNVQENVSGGDVREVAPVALNCRTEPIQSTNSASRSSACSSSAVQGGAAEMIIDKVASRVASFAERQAHASSALEQFSTEMVSSGGIVPVLVNGIGLDRAENHADANKPELTTGGSRLQSCLPSSSSSSADLPIENGQQAEAAESENDSENQSDQSSSSSSPSILPLNSNNANNQSQPGSSNGPAVEVDDDDDEDDEEVVEEVEDDNWKVAQIIYQAEPKHPLMLKDTLVEWAAGEEVYPDSRIAFRDLKDGCESRMKERFTGHIGRFNAWKTEILTTNTALLGETIENVRLNRGRIGELEVPPEWPGLINWRELLDKLGQITDAFFRRFTPARRLVRPVNAPLPQLNTTKLLGDRYHLYFLYNLQLCLEALVQAGNNFCNSADCIEEHYHFDEILRVVGCMQQKDCLTKFPAENPQRQLGEEGGGRRRRGSGYYRTQKRMRVQREEEEGEEEGEEEEEEEEEAEEEEDI